MSLCYYIKHTLPSSSILQSITITLLCASHTICQKSATVSSIGDWVARNALHCLYPWGSDRIACEIRLCGYSSTYTYIHVTCVYVISHAWIQFHSSLINCTVHNHTQIINKFLWSPVTHKAGCSHICSSRHVFQHQLYWNQSLLKSSGLAAPVLLH